MEARGFRNWLDGFAARAADAGLSRKRVEACLDALRPLPDVIDRDRTQAEFARAIWDYLDVAVSKARIRTGRAMQSRHRPLLDDISARYGVPPEIVVAIWGLESAYGDNLGNLPVLPALATLAFEGRRGAFFEAELIAALRIIEAGEVSAAGMFGSWAGAMGHTQFMPSTYLAHAVDFDGDGRRDIWSEDPTDALASTASYLAGCGWKTGQTWGMEVRFPDNFDHALAGRQVCRPWRSWRALGVEARGGGELQDDAPASILLPAGHLGPAILVLENFDVLRRYNAADSYVLAVGLLSNHLAGKPGLERGWPRHLKPLDRAAMAELQMRLTAAGYDTFGADGLAGPNTSAAIRAFQESRGLIADGYASAELLAALSS